MISAGCIPLSASRCNLDGHYPRSCEEGIDKGPWGTALTAKQRERVAGGGSCRRLTRGRTRGSSHCRCYFSSELGWVCVAVCAVACRENERAAPISCRRKRRDAERGWRGGIGPPADEESIATLPFPPAVFAKRAFGVAIRYSMRSVALRDSRPDRKVPTVPRSFGLVLRLGVRNRRVILSVHALALFACGAASWPTRSGQQQQQAILCRCIDTANNLLQYRIAWYPGSRLDLHYGRRRRSMSGNTNLVLCVGMNLSVICMIAARIVMSMEERAGRSLEDQISQYKCTRTYMLTRMLSQDILTNSFVFTAGA